MGSQWFYVKHGLFLLSRTFPKDYFKVSIHFHRHIHSGKMWAKCGCHPIPQALPPTMIRLDSMSLPCSLRLFSITFPHRRGCLADYYISEPTVIFSPTGPASLALKWDSINRHFPKNKNLSNHVRVNLLTISTFFKYWKTLSSHSLIKTDIRHLWGKRLSWQSTYMLLNSLHFLKTPLSRLRSPEP